MKVILTRDVKDTGHAYETIEVKDGHALNFLIPKKMAVLATPSSLKATESRRKTEADKRAMSVKLVEERLTALAEERVVIKKKANEKGHLYDAVGASEIAAAAQIPEDAIRLEKPLKELGTFDVPVVFGDRFGKFSIVIEGEE
jgi:large subunit ribosomal protein L9